MEIPEKHAARGFAWNATLGCVTLRGLPVADPVQGLDIPREALTAAERAWKSFWGNQPLPREKETEEEFANRVGTGF